MEFNESALGTKYSNFCELRNHAISVGEMDLSGINWFYPTTLLPLGIFIKEQQNISVIKPTNPNVLKYYDIITRDFGGHSPGKSYIPILQIPPDNHQREKMLEPLYTHDNGHVGGHNAFSYIIGELVDNVYQHSEFSTAYIMAQQDASFTEVGIIDNGISIPGALASAGFEFGDAKALSEAINGVSTKPGERGFGLKSTLKLFTEGLHGECLIISRGGGLIATRGEKTFYTLHDYYTFGGTFICASVPYTHREVNIYDYVE